MANNENSPRKLKGYYPFSKKYPSQRGNQAISESRRTHKRERNKRILFCVFLVCLFVFTFIFSKFMHNLVTRPLPEPEQNDNHIISTDNIGTIRAIYIENENLEDISDLSETLEKAKKNGFNAVMLDFKNKNGELAYKSNEINVPNQLNKIDDVIIEKIKAEGFMLIGRIYCFEDTVAPQRLNAYIYENVEKTEIWFDNSAILGGRVWLDPTNTRSQNYICDLIKEITKMGADCVYLDSVHFPEVNSSTKPVYTADDTTLNRNAVLLQFIEKAVDVAGRCPVIIGVDYEGAVGGNTEKWGGTLFDTAAAVCSPLVSVPEGSDYVEFVSSSYVVMNDNAKNNFSTLKIIPTVKNQPEDIEFYEKLAESQAESYIIVP